MKGNKCVFAGITLMAAVCWQLPCAADQTLIIKTVAEIESPGPGGDKRGAKLVPAHRVVPGDQILYTLEVRNAGAGELASPMVTNEVPEHMRYVAGSAAGPGAEVFFSVDGGRTFDRGENLKMRAADGRLRPAVAADYTHIRWHLKNRLKANSVAFVRFRAVVK